MRIVAKAALGCTAIACLNAMLALGESPRPNPLRPESAAPAPIFNPASADRQMSGAATYAPTRGEAN